MPREIRTHDPSNQAAKTYALDCAATKTGFSMPVLNEKTPISFLMVFPLLSLSTGLFIIQCNGHLHSVILHALPKNPYRYLLRFVSKYMKFEFLRWWKFGFCSWIHVHVHVDGRDWTAATNRPIVHPPDYIWVWRITVKWYRQGNPKNSEEKPIAVRLCPPQIPCGLTRAWTQASALRGRRVTTWAITCPCSWVFVSPCVKHTQRRILEVHNPFVPTFFSLGGNQSSGANSIKS
jgi:hypothetical protein